jgi:hypothetical protein
MRLTQCLQLRVGGSEFSVDVLYFTLILVRKRNSSSDSFSWGCHTILLTLTHWFTPLGATTLRRNKTFLAVHRTAMQGGGLAQCEI